MLTLTAADSLEIVVASGEVDVAASVSDVKAGTPTFAMPTSAILSQVTTGTHTLSAAPGAGSVRLVRDIHVTARSSAVVQLRISRAVGETTVVILVSASTSIANNASTTFE